MKYYRYYILYLCVFCILSTAVYASKPFSSSNEEEIGDLSDEQINIQKPVFKTKIKKQILDIKKDALIVKKISDNMYSVNGNHITDLLMVSFFDESSTYQIQTRKDRFSVSTQQQFSYDGEKLSVQRGTVNWNNIFTDVSVSQKTEFSNHDRMYTITGNFALVYEHSPSVRVCIDSTIDDKMSFAHCEDILDHTVEKDTIFWIGRKNSDYQLVCRGNASAYIKFSQQDRNVFVKGNTDDIIFKTDCTRSLDILSCPPLKKIVKKYVQRMQKEFDENIAVLQSFYKKELTAVQKSILDRRIAVEQESFAQKMSALDMKVPFIIYGDIRPKNINVYTVSVRSDDTSRKHVFYHCLKKQDADKQKGYFFFYDTDRTIIGEHLNNHVFSYENSTVSKLMLPTTHTQISYDQINANISGFIADISNKRLLLREAKTELVNAVEPFLNIMYSYNEKDQMDTIEFSTVSIDSLQFPGLGVNAGVLRQIAGTFGEKLLMSLSANILHPGAMEYVRNIIKEMLTQYIQEYLLFPEMLKGNENYFENFLSKVGYDHLSRIVSSISLNKEQQTALMDVTNVSQVKLIVERAQDTRDAAHIIIVLYETKEVEEEKKPVEVFRYISEDVPVTYEYKNMKFNMFDTIQKKIVQKEGITFSEMFTSFQQMNKYMDL